MADNNIVNTETDCVPILAVNDESLEKGIIYPNPVSETLNFTVNNVESFRIYDSLGRVIKQNDTVNNNSVYVGNLKNGIYFIEINTEANQVQIFKFVKD